MARAAAHWALFATLLTTYACSPDAATPESAADAGDDAPIADVSADAAADAAVDASVDAAADATAVEIAADSTLSDAAVDSAAEVVDAEALADAMDAADAAPDAIADILDTTDGFTGTDAADAGDALDTFDAGDILGLPLSPTNIDVNGQTWTCADPQWQAGACVAGLETSPPLQAGIHVDLPNPITYADSPPSSGKHRPAWGKWGQYIFLPQQRWLHNLEHGGVAFLYNPCASNTMITALWTIAHEKAADETGPFRWVLTPYPGLKSAIAVVAWGHVYAAECVNTTEITAFITAHYRKAPEDEPYPGTYEELWLGNWP